MEKTKEIKFSYVFNTPIAANHQASKSALEAKNMVLDLLIKKIILKTD